MSVRHKEVHGRVVHSLEEYVKPNEDIITVTKATDPQSGTADIVVENDHYVDGVIDSLVVDKCHIEVSDELVEMERTHVEAGDGRLDIDKTVETITKGHVEVTETHVEVTEDHFTEVVTTKTDDMGYDTTSTDLATSTEICSIGDAKGTMEMNTGIAKDGNSFTEMTVVKRKGESTLPDELPPPATGWKRKGKFTCCSRGVHRMQKRVTSFVSHHSRLIGFLFRLLFLLTYYAVFAYAMSYKFGDEGSIRFLIITVCLTLYVLYRLARLATKKKWKICCCLIRFFEYLKRARTGFWRLAEAMKLKAIICVLMTLFFLVYSVVVVGLNQPWNLISAVGMLLYLVIFFVFSDNPERVKWRPVFCGLAMQFVFAMMLMRSQSGAVVFLYLGDRITEFMTYADDGAKFVFGPTFADHFFAFKVMPVIIFFSSVISVLYHLGLMQFVIKHAGRLLTLILDTSPAENVVAVANIFLGQTEAPLLAGPYLATMTRSELHTVMSSGFATVAGPIMAAFAMYDVPVVHLLSASVMSAPAAIGMSKLFYPETEEPVKVTDDYIYKLKERSTNIIEAASNGALSSIKIIANILVHLVAFISILMFFNAACTFLGYRIGLIPPDYPELTYQLIYSYLFWPAAFLMGVDVADCGRVADMIGTKMIVNEFAAYSSLSEFIHNKATLLSYLDERNVTMATGYLSHWYHSGNDIILNATQQILIGGIITDRSTVISTYALCGFSNISAMGVMIGLLVAIIPNRKSDISRVVFRAMITGNVASFMTACMAGLLYKG